MCSSSHLQQRRQESIMQRFHNECNTLSENASLKNMFILPMVQWISNGSIPVPKVMLYTTEQPLAPLPRAISNNMMTVLMWNTLYRLQQNHKASKEFVHMLEAISHRACPRGRKSIEQTATTVGYECPQANVEGKLRRVHRVILICKATTAHQKSV